MCLPINQQNQLKGVVCVDIALDDLFSEISYFRQGASSYAFLMNRYRQLLVHPLIPPPSTATQDPILVDIKYIEYDHNGLIDALAQEMTA